MKKLVEFIKEICTQEEIQEIVKELVPYDLHTVPRSWEEAWVKSWKPDWNDETIYKYCIVFVENSPKVDKFWYNHKVLSFPIQEIAEDFLECFRDLIEKAKVLI